MKKFSFLAMAAFGLLFAACSSDKDTVAEQSGSDILKGKTEGFFKIDLNLPTTPVVSTRAWGEGTDATTLNDGLAVEYGVNSLILLLFDGADEANATLKQVITLASPTMTKVTPDNPNQVTTKTEYVAKLNAAPTGNLYALAVVNGKGNIEAGTDDTKVKLRGTEVSGIKIANLQAALAASSDVKTNDFIYEEGGVKYFFMTNAVLSNEKGGTVQPATAAGNMHILAPVDKNYIYETEAKATAGNAATDIYVERGMAKVTILSAALGTTALTAPTGVSLSAALDGWCLDITNKSSYVVRQVPTGNFWNLCSFSSTAATDKYRFVGGNPVDVEYGTATAGYRTYWAQDPNYSADLTFDANNQNATNFSYATYATDKSAAIGDENPQYCLENTFDVAHQDARYTTRVLLGVKLTSDGSEFYVMGADRKTMYTRNDVLDRVLSSLKTISVFSDWYATVGGGATLATSDITVTWDKTATEAGKLLVKSVVIPATKIATGAYASTDLTIDASSTTVDGKDFSGVISTLNTQLANVERFVGGVAYYAIRIKHFGDDLTPWNVDGAGSEYLTAPKESGIDDIYPNDARRDANYLGRYGMVRNNWYELVIGDIVKVGYSEPPTIPSHPDDDLEDQYIKARINILSWAKRTQNWQLK